MKALYVFAALLLVPGLAQAQTPTVAVEWTYTGLAPSEVATFTNPRVLVDNVAQAGTPSCEASGADTVCRQSIPTPPDATHTITVVAFQPKAGSDVSASIQNVNPAKAVKPGVKLIVQFTIEGS